MSESEDEKSIAQNPGTPPEKLRSLLKNTLEEEQKQFEKGQKELAESEGERYRLGLGYMYRSEILKFIAKNTNTPPDAFESLSRFNPPFTFRHPADSPTMWSDDDYTGVINVWTHKSECHYNNIYAIHHAVASNPSTPPEVLSFLSKDGDPNIRAAVAKNKNTPPDALAILKTDQVEWVRNGMSQEEYLQERRIAYRKEKYWKAFWECFPWSGGILGAICGLVGCAVSHGSDGGAFGGILVGTVLGGL